MSHSTVMTPTCKYRILLGHPGFEAPSYNHWSCNTIILHQIWRENKKKIISKNQRGNERTLVARRIKMYI